MSVLVSLFFCCSTFFSGFLFFLVVFNISLFFFLRASYPRMRYDFLMIMTWKRFLVVVLAGYLFVIRV